MSISNCRSRRATQAGVLHHIAPLAIVVVFGIVGIGLLVSSHAATPPTSSEPADPLYPSSGQVAQDKLLNPKIGATAYNNWSGYAATGKTFTKVYGALVVPTMSCPSASSQTLFWVGFDGFALTSNQTTEQIGIIARCDKVSGSPSYAGFWEMRSSRTDVEHILSAKTFSIAPNQKVDEMVTYNRRGQYVLSLQNLATKKKFTTTQQCTKGVTCKRQSAEWIGERPFVSNEGYQPLAPWGSMQFTKIQAATNFKSAMNPAGSYKYTLIDMFDQQAEAPLAQVSPLQQSGTAFTDTSI